MRPRPRPRPRARARAFKTGRKKSLRAKGKRGLASRTSRLPNKFWLLLAVIAVVAMGVAIRYGQRPDYRFLPSFFWIVACAVPFYFLREVKKKAPLSRLKWEGSEICAVLGLLLFAALLRFPYAYYVPLFTHNDEAIAGTLARRFLNSHSPPIFAPADWAMLPDFQYFLSGIAESIFGLRVWSAVIGLVGLLGTYLFVRESFSRRMALLVLVLESAFHWHVHVSRQAPYYFVTTTVWAFYFFFRAMRTDRLIYFGLAGVVAGLGLHTYAAARAVPVVFILWTICWVYFGKAAPRRPWLGVSIAVGFALWVWVPFWLPLTNSLSSITGRESEVSIFNPVNLEHLNFGAHLSVPRLLAHQLQRAIGFFWETPGMSGQYLQIEPMLDWPLRILFWAGALLSFWCFTDPAWYGIHWLFLSTIVAVTLTLDPPFTQRYSILCALFLIYPAFALERLMGFVCTLSSKKNKAGRWIAHLTVGIVMTWIVADNIQNYFGRYCRQSAFQRHDTYLRLAGAHPEAKSALLINIAEGVDRDIGRYYTPPHLFREKWVLAQATNACAMLVAQPRPTLVFAPAEEAVPKCLRDVPPQSIPWVITVQVPEAGRMQWWLLP